MRSCLTPTPARMRRANSRYLGRRGYAHIKLAGQAALAAGVQGQAAAEHRLFPAGRSAEERRPGCTPGLKLRMLLCSVLAYEKKHLVLVKPK